MAKEENNHLKNPKVDLPVLKPMENNNLVIEKKEEKAGIFDDMKELAMISFIEGLLPKLEPFIAPATAKLEEYFGNDTKVFLIRRMGGQPTKVIVLDNTKGDYLISSSVIDYTPEKVEGTDRFENELEVEKRLISQLDEKFTALYEKELNEIKSKSGKRVAEFSASKTAVINVHDTKVFIQKLLSGEFTNQK